MSLKRRTIRDYPGGHVRVRAGTHALPPWPCLLAALPSEVRGAGIGVCQKVAIHKGPSVGLPAQTGMSSIFSGRMEET